MKHRVKKKTLGRNTNQRKMLLRGLLRSLFEHGSITTTKAKAKEVKRLSDKLIYRAKTDSVATRRDLHRFFGKRDVVNTLVERIAPLFKKRDSGFTSIKEIGRRRGDNTKLVSLSLVKQPEEKGLSKPDSKKETKKSSKKVSKKSPAKKTSPAKSAKKADSEKSKPAKKNEKKETKSEKKDKK